MARLGSNVKLTLDAAGAALARKTFEGALGAQPIEPMPDLTVYRFADGGNVGVYTVPDGEALTGKQQGLGAWLEFAVDDVQAARAACEAAGCAPFVYGEGTLTYLRGPGGLCFRLSKG